MGPRRERSQELREPQDREKSTERSRGVVLEVVTVNEQRPRKVIPGGKTSVDEGRWLRMLHTDRDCDETVLEQEVDEREERMRRAREEQSERLRTAFIRGNREPGKVWSMGSTRINRSCPPFRNQGPRL